MHALIYGLASLRLALALPQTATSPPAPGGTVDILTSFTGYDGCNDTQKSILQQAINDAVRIAAAGIDQKHDELSTMVVPAIDWDKQASLDFWGPTGQNGPEQGRIFEAMYAASKAYRGWGFSDYWYNRYVYLTCTDYSRQKDCSSGKVVAFYSSTHDKKYPLVTFCSPFFDRPDKVPGLDEAIARAKKEPERQQNAINFRTRATTFMHELLHIGWGTAKECIGLADDEGCQDHYQDMGGKLGKSYRPGAAKLLARRNVTLAATNNDNYVFYAVARFMQNEFGKYPKYPSMWDPTKTREENEEAQKSEPGFPPEYKSVSMDDFGEDGEEVANLGDKSARKEFYKDTAYPDYYLPILQRKAGDEVPDVTEPKTDLPIYHGPTSKEIKCETKDDSARIADCLAGFSYLTSFGSLELVKGDKGGGNWVTDIGTCALQVSFSETWTDDCNMTNQDLYDYAIAIASNCGGDSPLIGGSADIKIKNCPGKVSLVPKKGDPPKLKPDPTTPGVKKCAKNDDCSTACCDKDSKICSTAENSTCM